MGRILTPPGTASTIDSDYNEISVFDSSEVKKAKIEQQIAKSIGMALVKEYPNRQWKVVVDIPGRMVIVACDSVSTTKGYHIHMKKHNILSLTKEACKAAGEILERHQLTRNKNFDAETLEHLARDSHDSVISSDSAADPI